MFLLRFAIKQQLSERSAPPSDPCPVGEGGGGGGGGEGEGAGAEGCSSAVLSPKSDKVQCACTGRSDVMH
jgi:hypothetical protein